MPTTVDRFIASYQLCQQVADMQNNMRANVLFYQHEAETPGRPMYQNWPLVQQAVRVDGAAFLQRITRLTTLVTDNLAALQAGTAVLGITWADITAMKDVLSTWATNMSTVTITNQTQLDNAVAALLAAVPAAMQPY